MFFAAIHVDEFMVQAVVRGDAGLRGRAVAIVAGTAPLWSVVAANKAALRAGIELGMAKSQAAQFAGVEIRHRSEGQEKAAHEALLDLGWSVTPRVEDTAADTMVADLAGLGALLGSEEKIAQGLMERSASLGLQARIGVAANVEVAILAARGLPGVTVIAPGTEAQRLSGLPVSTLLPSIEIQETLTRWGIATCGALAALPVIQLSERLGQEGVRLHTLARGAFERSLTLARPGIFFEEEMELDDSVEELESLSFVLGRLLDQLCERLAARSLAARAIHMEFELERSFEKELQQSAHPQQQKLIPGKFEKSLTLPVAMRDSKLLLKLARLRLQGDPPPAAVIKMRIFAEPDRPRTTQRGLFLPAAPEPEKLELTMARLANLVGDANVGSPQLLDTHRPDAVRMERFRLAQDAVGGRKKKPGGEKNSLMSRRLEQPAKAFRFFRPRVPARVELRDGSPARLFFQGQRGEVVAASGPWRISGEWWQEPWDQAEWDVEVRFSATNKKLRRPEEGGERGLYLIYYDAREKGWFLRGTYD
jgi:protein ImuB